MFFPSHFFHFLCLSFTYVLLSVFFLHSFLPPFFSSFLLSFFLSLYISLSSELSKSILRQSANHMVLRLQKNQFIAISQNRLHVGGIRCKAIDWLLSWVPEPCDFAAPLLESVLTHSDPLATLSCLLSLVTGFFFFFNHFVHQWISVWPLGCHHSSHIS